MNKKQQALDSFSQALVMNPKLTLPKEGFKEPLQSIWEQARKQVKEQSNGKNSIYTFPIGARIFIDGFFIGTSPATTDTLKTGAHLMKITYNGYQSISKFIRTQTKKTIIEQIHLKKLDIYKRLQEIQHNILQEKENSYQQLSQLFDTDEVFIAIVDIDGDKIKIMGRLVDNRNHKIIKSSNTIIQRKATLHKAQIEKWIKKQFS